MMKLTEIKKMLKEEFNEKYLYNLQRISITVQRRTYGVATVDIQVSYKIYTVATVGLLDDNLNIDQKQIEAINKYVAKLEKSFSKVEEMDVDVNNMLTIWSISRSKKTKKRLQKY